MPKNTDLLLANLKTQSNDEFTYQSSIEDEFHVVWRNLDLCPHTSVKKNIKNDSIKLLQGLNQSSVFVSENNESL